MSVSLLGSQVNKTADVRPEPQQDDQQAQKVEDQCDNLEGQQEGSVIKASPNNYDNDDASLTATIKATVDRKK